MIFIKNLTKHKGGPLCKKLYVFGQNSNPTVGYVGGLGFLKILRKIQQTGPPARPSAVKKVLCDPPQRDKREQNHVLSPGEERMTT